MIDEAAGVNDSSGVDFDSGNKSVEVAEDSGRQAQLALPQPMGQVVQGQAVQARVAEQYLQNRAGGRIIFPDNPDLSADKTEQISTSLNPSNLVGLGNYSSDAAKMSIACKNIGGPGQKPETINDIDI